MEKGPEIMSTVVESMQSPLVRENRLSDKMEELDEESPIGTEDNHLYNKPANAGSINAGAPSGVEPVEGDVECGTPNMMLPQTAMPLIILPVQSEGVPSSGGLPLGRILPASPPAPLRGDELKKLLIQQLEYYFSKDNLSSDKYLLSQMDGDNYVPISVLSNFNQVKRLTTDPGIMLESLRSSSVLQLDEGEEKVRSIPEKRVVLILREIPKETPKQDLVSLFANEDCPSCVTCEFADNNCWYVTFDSEESTQEAYAFLREKVKEFLGQPIRARIKGTTVQRSSGMPKPKHGPYSVQSSFNGGASQMPYYQPPLSGVLPWSPTPPTSTSSSPYFDPSSFSPLVGGNGFTPPQQAPPTQVGVISQSPGGGVLPGMLPTFNGTRYPAGFPYIGIRGEGERGGGGGGVNVTSGRGNRTGLPGRTHIRGVGGSSITGERERAQSPPPVPNGDIPAPGLDRERGDQYKGGRGLHGNSVVPAGGSGGGGKYKTDDRKISKLKNTRNARGSVDGSGEKTNERGPPRQQSQQQQQQQQQPKLDLATAHFPPLPTSGSENFINPSTSASLSSTHSHMTTSEDGQKTLSDIVKGGSRPPAISAGPPQQQPIVPVVNPTNGGLHAAVASNVVERTIASATAKLVSTQQTFAPPSNTTSTITNTTTTTITTTNTTSSENSELMNAKPNLLQGITPVPLERKIPGADVGEGEDLVVGVEKGVIAPTPRLSSVVSGAGHTHHQSGGGANKTAPTNNQPRPQRNDYRPPVHYRDRQNNAGNKGYNRYSDRDYSSNKQTRNPQVFRTDTRPAPNPSNTRGRVKGDQPQRNRIPNGPRPPHSKPSPKSYKKPLPGHSPQAPPPPPIPASSTSNESTASTESNSQATGSNSKTESVAASSHSQSETSSSSQAPKKLSYAQMAQKRNSKELSDVTDAPGSKPTSTTVSSSSISPTSPQTVISTTPAISTQSTTTTTASVTKVASPTNSKMDSATLSIAESSVCVASKSATPSPTKEPVLAGERANSKGKV